MTRLGFEPRPPKRLVPKTNVLDHSTIEPLTTPKVLLQALAPWTIGS